MDKTRHHWEILQRVSVDLVNMVREFMVIGEKGDGVLMATEIGEVYWMGEMKFGKISEQATLPTPLEVPNLASMAHGHDHILLLTESGEIYAMGLNYYGHLGQGHVGGGCYFSPLLISSPHKFTSIRCGFGHSLALTEDGKVWAWGDNMWGQVGVPSSTKSLPSPQQISELDPHRVVAVECGSYHSLALTDQGEVYAWGLNDLGQLGDGSKTSTHTPTQIATPSPVKSMAAGDCHTLLLTQTGEVYACGENGDSQLGLPDTTQSSASLVKVAGLPPISQIASHFNSNFSIAMSAVRECFVWGFLGKTFFSTPHRLPPIYSTLDSVLSFGSTSRNTPHSVRVKRFEYSMRIDSDTLTESLIGPIRVGNRVARMFDNPNSNPDVKFELGDKSILAHRRVLRISSSHFDRFFSESSSPDDLNPSAPISQSSANLLQHTTDSHTSPTSPLITIPIPDHSYPIFYAYLYFLYTGSLQVPAERLADLFELAHSHLESDLEKLCLARMSWTLSLDNCFDFYDLTDRYSLPEFQKDVLCFITNDFPEEQLIEAYQSLDPDFYQKLTTSIASYYN